MHVPAEAHRGDRPGPHGIYLFFELVKLRFPGQEKELATGLLSCHVFSSDYNKKNIVGVPLQDDNEMIWTHEDATAVVGGSQIIGLRLGVPEHGSC